MPPVTSAPRSGSNHGRPSKRRKSSGSIHWTAWVMGLSIASWITWLAMFQPSGYHLYDELLDEDLQVAAKARGHHKGNLDGSGGNKRHHKLLRKILDKQERRNLPTIERKKRPVTLGSVGATSNGDGYENDKENDENATPPPTEATTSGVGEEDDDDETEVVRKHAVDDVGTDPPAADDDDGGDDDSMDGVADDDDDDEAEDGNAADGAAAENDGEAEADGVAAAKKKLKTILKQQKAAARKNRNTKPKTKTKTKTKTAEKEEPTNEDGLPVGRELSPPKIGPHPETILGGSGTDPLNPRFLLVHIGKAGGTTLYSNLRNLCLRKNTEHNLLVQMHHRRHLAKNNTEYKYFHLPIRPREQVACITKLNRQNDPLKHDPSTEMILSRENMVLGYMHMNKLPFWWNANDDGECKMFVKKNGPSANDLGNVQDQITAILKLPGGEPNGHDLEILSNPPDPSGNPPDSGLKESTHFLLPVRDPIDRLVSAFNYLHPSNHIQTTNCDSYEAAEEHQLEKHASIQNNNANKGGKLLRTRPFKWWLLQSFYCRCFPTINDLADVFLPSSAKHQETVPGDMDPKARVACLDIARDVLRGTSAYKPDQPGFAKEHEIDLRWLDDNLKEETNIGHISMGYGFYYRRTLAKYPSKNITIIRTEHIWEDLQNLETELGGTALIEGHSTSHGSRTYNVAVKGKTKIGGDSPEQKSLRIKALCCAIRSEIRIYQELLDKASNLSAEQIRASLFQINDKCGDLSGCETPPPKDTAVAEAAAS